MTKPVRAMLVISLSSLISASTLGATESLLVVNKDAGTLSILDSTSGETRAEIPVGEGPHEVASTPDGLLAIVTLYGRLGGRGAGNTLAVVDVESGALEKTIDLGDHFRPHGIHCSTDGTTVFVTSEISEALLVVDISAGKVLSTRDTGGDSHMVAIDEPAKLAFATGIGQGELSILSLDENSEPRIIDNGQGTEALALRPGTSEVWVGNNALQTVNAYDIDTGEQLASIECGIQPIRVTFTPDGAFALVSLLATGDIAVIDAENRELARRIKLTDAALDPEDWQGKPVEEIRAVVTESIQNGGARPIGILAQPDGSRIFVAARGLDHIVVIDPKSWEIVDRWDTGRGPDGLAWSSIE